MSGTLRSSLAEFAGTFALVWLAASAACLGGPGSLGAALAYGLAFGMLVYAFGCADAHFNPALTVALCLTRRIDIARGLLLVFSQLLGAGLAGLFLLRSLHGQAAAGICALHGIGFRMGTLIEAMATFWVVFVYCSARLDAPDRSGGAAIAAAAVCACLATAALTGGAFNPARSFGPALALGRWSDWYVYWAGPLVGAALAAQLYERLFVAKAREKP
ncbi:MAG: aquaporin [Elusimicrobia bacterium]|nr:aquaporin [Elusimicrobiota bacterium]MDE2237045.1 aquaporin [Elusimicrobiota bacterium]MDE2425895.1 aquaporin [Elusimicrobiota bacterium]